MRIAVEYLIDEPLEAGWADLEDLASHDEWMTEAGSVEIVSDQDRGVGTVMRVPTHVGPLSTEDWIVVTSWEDRREIGASRSARSDHRRSPSSLRPRRCARSSVRREKTPVRSARCGSAARRQPRAGAARAACRRRTGRPSTPVKAPPEEQ